MSRNYFIYSDVKLEQNIPFPEKLSQFFEQYHGFGEESEVAQVSVLLDIDLSIFQKWSAPDSATIIWLDLKEVIDKIRLLLDGIRLNPDYAKGVRYGGIPAAVMKAEFLKATAARNDKNIEEIVKRWQNTPDSAYPPDTYYLSSNLLMMELLRLQKILLQIQDAGGKRIYLEYR